MIEIQGDTSQAEILVREVPDFASKAQVRAINRGISAARTVMVKAVAADTSLRSSTVREAMRLENASLNRVEGRLSATLKRIPLIEFRATGPEPSRGRGRGVSYKLSGGRGRLSSGFIATMRSGHRGVFVRVGAERRSVGAWGKNLPIVEQFGPSIGHVFAKYRPQGVARALEMYRTTFSYELNRLLNRSRGEGTTSTTILADESDGSDA